MNLAKNEGISVAELLLRPVYFSNIKPVDAKHNTSQLACLY
jgi:hypothetical protein